MKYATARSVECHVPGVTTLEGDQPDPNRGPGLVRFAGEVVFRRLLTPHVPFVLSPRCVLRSLVVVLNQVYARLLDEVVWNDAVNFEAALRLDARIKHHVIQPVTRDLAVVASANLARSMQPFLTGKT